MTPLTPPLPREIQVEVTGACNLRCRMCLVRYRPALDRTSGSLSLERFERLVDELPALSTITLQGLGEPLLAPHLVDMVAYASARKCRVGFNSNATLLTRRRAEALVRAGLSWLHVSIDGATAATYEAIRDGARFETVVANLRGLVEVKRALGADDPQLSVVFVAMRRNVRELPDLVRSVAAWGVPRLRVQNLSHSFSDTDPAGAYREIREFAAAEALWADEGEAAAIFSAARGVAAEVGVDLRLPRLDEAPAPAPGATGCDWPWRSAYVTYAGDVQPCCMVMGADRARLGNLAERSLTDIWGGPAYREFRAALMTRTPPGICRGCAMYRGVF